MFDWLTTEQRASYAEDSQIQDAAPETPAPVFAYRALRNVLFGSPERDDDDDDNTPGIESEDKENVPPPIVIRPTTPPSTKLRPLRERDERILPSSTPASTSPSRLKAHRRNLSPTKSILRTPGIPTPRRQNVSVTFKDARASVSPSTTKATNGNRTALPPKSSSTSTDILKHKPASPKVPTIIKRTTSENKPAAIPEDDYGQQLHERKILAEAYVKSAERDMKKLVRYGQRMREYARVSQQENAALKKQLEKVKQENERLREGEKNKASAINTKGQEQREGVERDSATNTKAKEQKSVVEKPLSIVDQEQEAKTSTRTAAAEPAPKIAKQSGQPSLRIIQNSQTRRFTPPVQAPIFIKLEQRSAEKRAVEKGPTVGGEIARKLFSEQQSVRKVQLPPDRLAAAKERLRIKSEERKKMLGMGGNTRPGGDAVESSQVDWQGL